MIHLIIQVICVVWPVSACIVVMYAPELLESTDDKQTS
jgi:hypothetical protein